MSRCGPCGPVREGEAGIPLFEYQAQDAQRACAFCAGRFERLQRAAEPLLTACPQCGAPVRRLISAPAVGASRSGLDARAKSAGFHKLKRLGRGEYEKQY